MKDKKNIVIIGAGIAGRLLEQDIKRHHADKKFIGFVDDSLRNKKTSSYLGKIADLPKINDLFQVDEMVIAIPSADGKLIRKILLSNLSNRIPIRIVPRSQKIIGLDEVKYSDVAELDLEDFLGRPFLKKNVEQLKKFYRDKKILITGGAGSIGSEIVRQLLDLGAKKVIAFDMSEYLIFNLDQNLREKSVSGKKYKLVIGNILNLKKFDALLKKEKPDIIFHAAAYKHVYLMEENTDEAISNNVLGTKNVVDLAIANNVKNFVFISTDKVVNPTSIMGATKKISEYYIRSLPKVKTKFNIVRFGNVINSHGSVLPLFERQIKENGYVTVTHRNIERYFMSIREAAQLVIRSSATNRAGEIFILDMGELVNIYETALCLIRSTNLIPHKDVGVKFIGLKKGEKMIEELFTEKERKNLARTGINNIFRLKNFEKCPYDIEKIIFQAEELTQKHSGNAQIRAFLEKIFPSLGD